MALTGLDETNIILAMDTSQMNSTKVVAKINRSSFAGSGECQRGMVDDVVSRRRLHRSPSPCMSAPCKNGFEVGGTSKTLHRLVGSQVRRWVQCGPRPALHRCAAQGSDALRKGLLVSRHR